MIADREAMLLRRNYRAANDDQPAEPNRRDWLAIATWTMATLLALSGLGFVAAVVLDWPSLTTLWFGWALIGSAVTLALLDFCLWFKVDGSDHG